MKNHSKTKTAACCLFRSRTLRAPAIALAGGIAAFLGLDHQASAQAIDTIPSWNGTSSIGSFGQVNTATYGQTFTLTQTGYLSSVEFLIKDNSANPIAYQPFIYAFSGNKIVGNALFTGAAGTLSPGSTFAPVTFSTGNLSLPAGQYVVFFTTSTTASLGNSFSSWGSLTNDTVYSGGEFVYQNNGANFNSLFSTNWSSILEDLAFDLNISYALVNPLGNTLSGPAVIPESLINFGTVSPGLGSLAVQGSFTQMASGNLVIDLKSPTQFSQLNSTGAAVLAGGLTLQAVDGFKPQAGEKFTFLTAGGGVSGTFGTLTDRSGDTGTLLGLELIYNPTSVSFEYTQGSFKRFALTNNLSPNETALAGSLDNAVAARRLPGLIQFLDGEPLGNLAGDFYKLSPAELTSIFTVGVALDEAQVMNLQRRTDELRSGSSGFSASGFHMAGSGPNYSGDFGITSGVAGPAGPDGKESKEVSPVLPIDKRWGVFVTGVGERLEVGGNSNSDGYIVDTGGVTLGVDYKFSPHFAAGISLGYAGTTANLSDRGRVWVNGGKLGLYATAFTGGFYTDFAVSGGYNGYDSRRAGISGDARGSTDGGDLNTLFGTGYDFKKGGLTFGPTATFNYTFLGTDAFTENGSLAPLSVNGGQGESLRSAVGFKATYDWKVGGILIRPELRTAWQHEFGDTAYTLDSSFVNGAGDTFSSTGPKIGRDSALLGAGFAIQWNQRCTSYVYYDGELGRTNYHVANVSAGLGIAF